jgi:hypothetical protein
VLVGMSIAPASPLLEGLAGRARWLGLAIAGGVVVAATAGALAARPISQDTPLALNLALHHDASLGSTRWLANSWSPVPDELGPGFTTAQPAFPWGQEPAFTWWSPDANPRPAPSVALPAPELVNVERSSEGDRVRLRATLRSQRSARLAAIALPPTVRVLSMAMAGVAVPEMDAAALKRRAGWHVYTCETLPPEGIAIELVIVLGGTAPTDIVVVDRTEGLPPSTIAPTPQRPAWVVPESEGDSTIVTRRQSL